jgi:hypothetical protein
MREFAADFDWVDDPASLPAADWNEDLGLMLYDVFDHRQRALGFRWLRTGEVAAPAPECRRPPQDWKGARIAPSAAFFQARVAGGVMECHPDRLEIKFQRKGAE